MKKFLPVVSICTALAACKIEPSRTLRMQASDLASPHVHHGTQSAFVVHDYVNGLLELPSGLDFDGEVITGNLEHELNVAHIVGDGEDLFVPFFRGAKRAITLSIPGFEREEVKVKGVFNAWNSDATILKWTGNAFEAPLVLAPGEYAYKLVVNGEEVLDPSNEVTVPNGFGSFNNVLTVEGGRGEAPVAIDFQFVHEGSLQFSSIPEDQEVLAFFNNRVIDVVRDEDGLSITIPSDAKEWERAWIRLYTARNGQQGGDWLIPLKFGEVVIDTKELDRKDWHTSIMYFAMVDRFYNGNPSNDQPIQDSTVHPRANYQGGDVEGLRLKLTDGYFDALHTNTLWISPITQNPENAWGLWNQGGPVSKFSGYHGYWPISNIKPDHRFASSEELHLFLDDAHAKKQNVLLDYVANHVHELHPVYQKHPNWATNKFTADGRLNTQLWDEERLTTWFDTFMPTLELRNDTVAELMSDSALVWITEYNFDGFRHDATKHIPMNFTRLLTEKIRAASDDHVYQIGETYGSDELIASYVGSGKVDAQFNFNLYDAAFEAFTQEGATFDRLRKALESSLTYYGHHHLMGNISGNQDKPRFSSMASGHLSISEDSKLAGWTREIPKPNERGYRKMAVMHAFNIVVPGIPILYYGDEIALHGGNDPDNRKMMQFDFSPRQQQLFDCIARLNENRRQIMALNYGSTTVYQPEKHLLIIMRKYMEQEVRFFFNNSNEDHYLENWDITVPADDFTYQTEILDRE
ncbi:MAG TPA: alpha-amlyase [Cryomorphaceae bacterium]|nr:alpha-amlyase [Cryomorphaceae bacterium]